MKTAAEMTGYGRRGKPIPGFPPRPQPLEIDARFPHSRSRDEQWKSGKPKAVFPLSHCRCCTQSTDLKTKTWRPAARSSAPPFRLILQLENAEILFHQKVEAVSLMRRRSRSEICRSNPLHVLGIQEGTRMIFTYQIDVCLGWDRLFIPDRPECGVNEQSPKGSVFEVVCRSHSCCEHSGGLTAGAGISVRPGHGKHRIVYLSDDRWVACLHPGKNLAEKQWCARLGLR